MKFRIYLHIGRHKTGTTQIQRWLMKNREELKKNGYYYPETGMSPTSGQGGLPWSIRFRGDHASLFRQLKEEVIECGCDNIIISSEAFLEPGVWEDILFEYFADQIYDVRIIAYIRRQDEFFESAYNQAVKGAGRMCEPSQYHCRLDHRDVLAGWMKQFGRNKFSIGVYAKPLFRNGDLIYDFCSRIGIDPQGFAILSSDANQSLSRRSIEFIRVINKMQLPAAEREQLVARFLELKDLHFEDTCPYFLSPVDRQSLIDQHVDSNSSLAQDYGLTSDQLDYLTGRADERNWFPVSPLLLQEVAINMYKLSI